MKKILARIQLFYRVTKNTCCVMWYRVLTWLLLFIARFK